MTTTVRPLGPEPRAADGVYARSYEICDNGTAVGRLSVAVRHGPAGPEGWIDELSVAPGHRRRGRGGVAALAAEEILRGRGCRQVQVAVRAEEDAGRLAAAAFGYHELSRNLVKPLGPQAPPAGRLTIRPMRDGEYPRWIAAQREAFAASWADRGLSAEQAAARSDEAYGRLLPQGLETPGGALRVAEHDGERAGTLWVRTEGPFSDGAEAFVYDVAVEAGHRRRGVGRELMLEAERVGHAAGARSLGLHVFSDNTSARALYDGLGYRAVRYNLIKRLC